MRIGAVSLWLVLGTAAAAQEIAAPPKATPAEDADATTLAMIAALGSESPDRRDDAAMHFMHHPDPRAFPGLVRLTYDRNEPIAEIRHKAVRALGSLRMKEAYPHLKRVIADDVVPPIRYVAVIALGRCGEPKAFDDLQAWLETDREPKYRHLAAYALGLTRDKRAVPLLAKAMASPEKSVRRDAARALLELADPEGCAIILGRLPSETSGEAMKEMVKVLGDLKCQDAPAVFEDMKKKLDTTRGEFLHMNTFMDNATVKITGKRPE